MKELFSKTNVKLLVNLIGFVFLIYLMICFIDIKSAISDKKTIDYVYINRKIKKGEKGDTRYIMNFYFSGRKDYVQITSEEYKSLEVEKYPDLFLSKRTGKIISKLELKFISIMIMFLVITLVLIFPWSLFRGNANLTIKS